MVDIRTDALRLAARRLRRGRVVLCAVVLLLASAIATAVSVAYLSDALVARPIRVPHVERVVRTDDGQLVSSMAASVLRDTVRGARIAAYRPYEFAVRIGDRTVRAQGQFVSDDYLDVLGVGPTMSGVGVATVSRAFWHEMIAAGDGSPDMRVGVPATVQGHPMRLIAVVRDDFAGLSVGGGADILVPVGNQPVVAPELGRLGPEHRWLGLVGRLTDGATRQAATAELQARADELRGGVPRSGLAWVPAADVALPGRLRATVQRTLALLLGVTICLLVLAIANSAALVAWRAAKHRPDDAVVLALGLPKSRLLTEQLFEAGAVALSVFGIAALLAWISASTIRGGHLGGLLSVRVAPAPDTQGFILPMSAALSLLATALSWAWPLLETRRTIATDVLSRSGSRVIHGGPWLRRVWMATQIAAGSTALLVALTLMSSLQRQYAVPWGFDPRRVLVWQAATPAAPEAAAVFYDQLVRELERSPHIDGVGIAAVRPFGGLRIRRSLQSNHGVIDVFSNVVSPGYFQTMGVPVTSGKVFSKTEPGIMVNHSLALLLWGRADAVGQSIRVADDGPWPLTARVTGVVADAIYDAPEERHLPVVYLPLELDYRPGLFVLMHATSEADTVQAAADAHLIASQVTRADERVDVRAFDELIRRWTSHSEALAILLGGLSAGLLILTTLGLSALLGYVVEGRRRELAVRMALGATPHRLAASLMVECGFIATIGGAVGIILADMVVNRLSAFVFEGAATVALSHVALTLVLVFAACGVAGIPSATKTVLLQPAGLLRRDA